MNVIIDNETEINLDEHYSTINLAVLKTLEYEEFTNNVEVSVLFVDNEEIRKFNNKYRKIDKATDVLSFPLLDDFSDIDLENTVCLGDIVISVEKAIMQAEEYGHSLKREIAFLVIHSVLHLLGYDHMTPEEETEMIEKQKQIFLLCNINRE